MIEASVYRHNELIMSSTFYSPNLSLYQAEANMRLYIINEGLNLFGECTIKTKFTNLQKTI